MLVSRSQASPPATLQGTPVMGLHGVCIAVPEVVIMPVVVVPLADVATVTAFVDVTVTPTVVEVAPPDPVLPVDPDLHARRLAAAMPETTTELRTHDEARMFFSLGSHRLQVLSEDPLIC
jgi:hypothetical protein